MLRLIGAKITVNLGKNEFECAHTVYLGHMVGQGQVKPVDVKVEAAASFPMPSYEKQVDSSVSKSQALIS